MVEHKWPYGEENLPPQRRLKTNRFIRKAMAWAFDTLTGGLIVGSFVALFMVTVALSQ